MSIKASIYHLTHYKYDRPVVLGPQIIRLQPAPHSRTKVLSHSLKVEPANHFVNLQQDPYGNFLARFVFPEPVTELKIEVDLVADMTVYNPFDFFVEDRRPRHWPFDYPEDIARRSRDLPEAGAGRAAARQRSSPAIDRSRDQHRQFHRRPQRAPAARDRLHHPHGDRRADAGGDAGRRARAPAAIRAGCWCRSLRNLGLAARFVSGYLIQLKPDLVALDGPPGTDRSTSPTCTPGARSICPAPAGSASTRPRAC